MRITTLTLHPALDRLLDTARIETGGLFDVRVRAVIPAGKGINTARVLRRLTGAPVSAAAWVGAKEARLFRERLRGEGIEAKLCLRACSTRWGVTLLESSGRETHFKETMPAPAPGEARTLLRYLKNLQGGMLAVCGSAPPGTSRALLRQVMRRVRERFRWLVVDSNGSLLDEAGRVGCDGLKGNDAEIGAWLGLNVPWSAAHRAHRRPLLAQLKRRQRQRKPGAILVTLGARGAALATPEGLWLACPPRIAASAIASPTGCGDAATAGWLWALADGASPDETLRRAVACGTAKLLSADPGALDTRTVRRLVARIRVSRIE